MESTWIDSLTECEDLEEVRVSQIRQGLRAARKEACDKNEFDRIAKLFARAAGLRVAQSLAVQPIPGMPVWCLHKPRDGYKLEEVGICVSVSEPLTPHHHHSTIAKLRLQGSGGLFFWNVSKESYTAVVIGNDGLFQNIVTGEHLKESECSVEFREAWDAMM